MRGRLVPWIVLTVVSILALAYLLFVYPAHAHVANIFKCAKQLGIEGTTVAVPTTEGIEDSTGLYIERYDRNRDGKHDIITMSHVKESYVNKGGSEPVLVHHEHPIFYMVDHDLDGEPDASYVDKGPGGQCDDIGLYEDFNVPSSREDTIRRGGRVGL